MSARECGESYWEVVEDACKQFASNTAIEFGEEKWRYSEFYNKADSYRKWLNEQLDHVPVVVRAKNANHGAAIIAAAIAAKCVPLLADSEWGDTEVGKILEQTRTSVVLLHNDDTLDREGLRLLSEQDCYALYAVHGVARGSALAPEIAFGRFTSGSTGLPKCLLFTADAAIMAARTWVSGSGMRQDDRIFCLANLTNGLAFNTSFLSTFLCGATLIMHKGHPLGSSILRAIAKHQPSILVAFPFVYEMLMKKPARTEELISINKAISASAPLHESVKEIWKRVTGKHICNYYGIAEVGPCTFHDGIAKDSVGKPLPGVSIKVLDGEREEIGGGGTGVICVKTAYMASAYMEAPDLLRARIDRDGFYVSSDLGALDKSGSLHLKGRCDRVINLEGKKVDPSEIESVIWQLPGVEDVYVKGVVKDERTTLAAYVQSSVIDRQRVISHCVKHLEQHKVPQMVKLVNELPKGSTGKVLSSLLS